MQAHRSARRGAGEARRVRAEPATLRAPVPKRQLTIDASCLAAITAVSALSYLPHLGFYSDDWSNLARFISEPHISLGSVLAESASRPVQGAYFALLFKLFGLNPLGYHLVNTAVLSASISLLYLLLARCASDAFKRSQPVSSLRCCPSCRRYGSGLRPPR